MIKGLSTFEFSEHATREIKRRRLDTIVIDGVLRKPEQVYNVSESRVVMQSTQTIDGVPYLMRVFVDVDRAPPVVVTAYRTSKVQKYWRREE